MEESSNVDVDQSVNQPTEEKLSFKDKLRFACTIASPMASKSLCKRLYKLIKEASQDKNKNLVVGLKAVQKAIRKDESGLVVIGADVSPVDTIIHIPVVCEQRDIPYCFTPSRTDVGHAVGMKRAVVIVLIKENDAYKDLYEECKEMVSNLPGVS